MESHWVMKAPCVYLLREVWKMMFRSSEVQKAMWTMEAYQKVLWGMLATRLGAMVEYFGKELAIFPFFLSICLRLNWKIVD